MPRSGPGAALLVVVVAVAALASACSAKTKTARQATMSPSADAAAEAPAGDDDLGGEAAAGPERALEPIDELASLEAQLYEGEAGLRSVGVKLEFGAEDGETEEGEVQMSATAKCERICSIATAVCDLETKICDLADRHAGEDRYEKACARVQSDCERATEACDACK